MEYIPYLQIAENLDIKKGDNIYLSSQVLRLAVICRKHGEHFDPDKFIDTFLEKIGDTGTLLIPTFNWEFSEIGKYDYRNSPSTVGSLGNIALSRSDFTRTEHPMHSFAVWGKGKKELCEAKQVDSYDEQSPFRYLLDHKGKEIIVGTDIKHAMTMIHYVEKKVGVPYRFTKYFTGRYVDGNGHEEIREYSTYARYFCINAQEQQMRLEDEFIEKNATVKKYINGEQFWINDMQACFDIMEKELKYNQAKRMYDFTWTREDVFLYGHYGEKMASIIETYRQEKQKGELLIRELWEKINEVGNQYGKCQDKNNILITKGNSDPETEVLYLYLLKWALKEKSDTCNIYTDEKQLDGKEICKVINVDASVHGGYSKNLYDLGNKNIAENIMEIFNIYKEMLGNEGVE